METNEHKAAGDEIRVAEYDNKYLSGGTELNPLSKDGKPLTITTMQLVAGIPVPLPKLKLTSGDFVALAGDYYTLAGWYKNFQIPANISNKTDRNKEILEVHVNPKEENAFIQAYSNLANPTVTEETIKKIYAIEKDPQLLQQVEYSFLISGYGQKLLNNEAHFSPWSTRAYTIAHTQALEYARLAYFFKQLEESKIKLDDEVNYPDTKIEDTDFKEIKKIIQEIKANPTKYGFEKLPEDKELFAELRQRYHALALGAELFGHHFYSDHFAGGHLDRLGEMRVTLPQKFGTLGSILVNNMHTEDNTLGVRVYNVTQVSTDDDKILVMPITTNIADGDDNYDKISNDANANNLVNGMTNSVGDIYRVMGSGNKIPPDQFGGAPFLPSINFDVAQNQPLFVADKNGDIYFRRNVSRIEKLTPQEYASLREDPANDKNYEKLTTWKSFVLVIKLRLLGFIYSPKPVELSNKRKEEIKSAEQQWKNEKGTKKSVELTVEGHKEVSQVDIENKEKIKPHHIVKSIQKPKEQDQKDMVMQQTSDTEKKNQQEIIEKKSTWDKKPPAEFRKNLSQKKPENPQGENNKINVLRIRGG